MPDIQIDSVKKDFVKYLDSLGLSPKTHKNYRSDLGNFLGWAIKKIRSIGSYVQSLTDLVPFLSRDLAEEYKNSMIEETVPAKTVNRRLSTLRHLSRFLVEAQITDFDFTEGLENISFKIKKVVTENPAVTDFKSFLEKEKVSPNTVKNYLSDIKHFISFHPSLPEVTPELIKKYQNDLSQNFSEASLKRKSISLKKFLDWAKEKGLIEISLEKKITVNNAEKFSGKHKARRAFSKWYKGYRNIPGATYLNIAVLIILVSALGFGIYNQFVKNTSKPLAATTLTRPSRYLSFQGRLTSQYGNPITAPTNVAFNLYSAATGGTSLWTGTCSVSPDSDGVFSTLLGSTCGSELSSSIFSDNAAVWLGITVGSDAEATPRIQIATVAYALNSETLQGYPASASATINTVPVINNLGQMVLAVSSPKIQSTTGNFAIEGQTVTIDTPTASNGNINISPDGTGQLNLTFSGASPGSGTGMVNATDANLTSGSLYYGAVANNASGYNLLQLQSGSSLTNKFVVDSAGNVTTAGTINGLSTSGGVINSGTWHGSTITTNYGGTGADNSGAAQYSVPYYSSTGVLGGTVAPNTAGYVLSTNSTGGAPTWIPMTATGTNYWKLASGAVSPFSDNLDVLIGSSATTSAKFAFTGVNSGTPTASISGTGIGVATYLTGDGTLATTNMGHLILGGGTTGQVDVNNNLNLTTGNAYLINGTSVLNGTTLGPNIVNSSLAQVGVLASGSVTNGFGTISTANTITGTTLNGTTGVNTGATAGTQRIDASGNLVNIGNITGTGSIALSSGGTNQNISIDASGNGVVNIGGTSTGDVNLAGGSGSTGCTVTNSNGNLVCSGTVTATGGITATSLPFSGLTGATNTTAAMLVGTGASLNYTGTGTINASSLTGNTWAAPGTIGSTTPNTGAFTSLTSSGNTTLGTGASSVNTIGSTTTPGALTLHGATSLDNTFTVSGSNLTSLGGNLTVTGTTWTATPTISGLITASLGLTSNGNVTVQNNSNLTQTGSGTFGTGTSAVSLNGDTTIAANKGLTMPSGTGVFAHTFSNSTASNAQTLAVANTNSGAGVTIGGIDLTPTNNTAPSGGTNTMNVISFEAGTGGNTTGLTTNGINFTSATGYKNFLNTPSIVIDSSGNMSGVGTIGSGAITSTSTITGTVLNGTTGINTGAGAGTQRIDASGNLTNIGTTQLHGITYTWPSADSAGTNYVLSSNGSGALSWIAQNGGTNYWRLANGTLSPFSDSLDVLIGSSATSSAKFAFTGVGSGTPTASIAGTTTGVATFIDGNGNISSTNRNNLSLGNSSTYNTTGNLLLNSNGVGNVGIGTTSPISKLTVIGTSANSTGKAAFLVDQYESQDIFTASASGTTKMTLANDGTLSLYNATSSIANTSGDITLNAASGLVAFSGNSIGNLLNATISGVLNAGGKSQVAYNTFATSGDSPTSSAITTSNDLFVGGDTEIKGGLYLSGRNIYNGSVGAISFALDPTAINSPNYLSYGSWLVQNSVNNGMAALMVNQNKGGDIFSASASGVPKMTLTNAGNLGLGTTTPAARLDIGGSTSTITNTAGDLTLSAASNVISLNSDTLTNLLRVTAGSGTVAAPTYSFSSDSDTGMYAGGVNVLKLATNGTDRMTIDASGNVGIGTTSPGYKLDVTGDANLTGGNLYFSGTGGRNIFNGSVGAITFASDPTLINSYNYITDGSWLVQNSVNNGIAALMVNQTKGGDIFTASASGTPKFVINNAGNVGIGTTAPLSQLSVGGAGNATYAIYGAAVAGGKGVYGFASGGVGVFGLDSTGNGVYGDGGSNGVYGTNLQTTGYGVYCNSNNVNGCGGNRAWTNSSDARLKENVVTISNALDKVMHLRGVNFNWIDGGGADTGFIAQEVLPYVPEVVGVDTNTGMYNMRTGQLTGLLVEAIKDQQGQIASLSGQLANLNLTDTGDLNISQDNSGNYQLTNTTNNSVINQIAALAKLVVANIKAGAITTSDLATNTFTAFQGTVDNLLVKSGLVAMNIQTKLISPLPDGTDVTVQIGSEATPSGQFVIQNASGSAVATIDNTGNATFSGQVASSQLQVASEATISGTLYADDIKSKSLDDIQALLTKVETDQNVLKNTVDWSSLTATDSASLDQIAVDSLYVTNQAAINSLSVTNSLALGSDMVIGNDNTINTLSSPLKIQSLAMASVEVMGGLVTIDTKGNVNIAGNLAIGGNLDVAGRVASSGLTLKDTIGNVQGDNLYMSDATASGSLLTLQNSSGNVVSSVDASGSAQFNNLTTGGLTIASDNLATTSAVINGTISTNATAGQGIIPAGTSEITIKNPKITDYTLVYVTPTSTTQNYVLYVKSKENGHFVVGFTNPIDVDVNFNWWIVQVQ